MLPLTRELSSLALAWFARAGVTPALTGAGAVLAGLEAAWAFSIGTARGDFVGALSWLLACLLFDISRMQIAAGAAHWRFTPATTCACAGITYTLLFLSLGFGAVGAGAGTFVWYAAVAAGFGCAVTTIVEFSRNIRGALTVPGYLPQHITFSQTSRPWDWWLNVIRTDLGFVLMLAAGLDLVWLFLLVAAITAQLYWIRLPWRFAFARKL
ncbi:MAG: hypothetical protein AAF458_14945 [Pseudomonadota bacterium]